MLVRLGREGISEKFLRGKLAVLDVLTTGGFHHDGGAAGVNLV